MNIDIVVAKLVRKGFTESRAKSYANELLKYSKIYGIEIFSMIDQISPDFKLNDLGEFIMNNTVRQGYQTGRISGRTPNKYVARSIIE
jgi:hypothetical protein